jgi:hypothetical protein
MGAADSRSLRPERYAIMRHFVHRSIFAPFEGFWGMNVRREFLQRLFVALHGTLGSYFRDALQEESANVLACLLVPLAQTSGVFPSVFFLLFDWWFPLPFYGKDF